MKSAHCSELALECPSVSSRNLPVSKTDAASATHHDPPSEPFETILKRMLGDVIV